jgi:hypothetical protein
VSEVNVYKIDNEFALKWDAFISNSANETIFHSYRFLNYHGQRFANNSHHIVFEKSGNILAVMPMAIFEEDGAQIAKSPYAASYGGIVTKYRPSYSDSKLLVESLIDYLKTNAITKLTITPPIHVCDASHSDTFLFAFLEQGFKIVNSDISSVIPLTDTDIERNVFTSRARNMARKAENNGVSITFRADIEPFWMLMEKTFSKHGTNSTHNKKEWEWLCTNLPDDIWCDVAFIGDTPVAGVGHVKINSRVDSSFYLCSDPEYQNTQALTYLVYNSVLQAKKSGFSFFDFGTSSVNMVARENIFRFKESFGAEGVFRHTLQIEL